MAGTKRKSTGQDNASSSAKKARASDAHATAKALISDVLDASENYELPEDDDAIIGNLQALARYARYLEEQLNSADIAAPETATATASKKTPEQLEEAAEKIRAAAVKGIKKQMTDRKSVV